MTSDPVLASGCGEGVLHALQARRSTSKVRPERPPREVIERVLQAAAWAPNHYRTEPWRLFVLAGSARAKLAGILVRSMRTRLDDPDSNESRIVLEKERQKPMRAPVIVVVAAVPSKLPKVEFVEELAATSAAVQNILLAAEALGLGAMWRTGAPARDPEVKRFLGLGEDAHIVAFVYLGYPDGHGEHERERTIHQHTSWLDWDESSDERLPAAQEPVEK
ncbi:MAG: nitroreductase family protein [Chloroflexota bacterium]